MKTYNWEGVNPDGYFLDKLEPIPSALPSFQKLFQVSARSEERFSRNAETDLVCRLLLEKKKNISKSSIHITGIITSRLLVWIIIKAMIIKIPMLGQMHGHS